MNEANKQEWETKKLQAEVNKLQNEASLIQSKKVRAWIMVVSVAVGIIVSSVGIYKSMSEIASKNKQLSMESTIRSHQIFLNHVLDRMSGIQTDTEELNSDGNLMIVKRERFGGTTQVGAYAAALALACEFKNLRLPAEEALKWQVETTSGDKTAAVMLERLKNGCGAISN